MGQAVDMADAPTRALVLRQAARTHRGLVRSGNQDSYYAGSRLLAVADGMGGAAAGDVASNTVIEAMGPLDEAPAASIGLINELRRAVDVANQRLRDAVEANPEMEGMGTTLTAMLFDQGALGMVHIGDSRAYRIRNGEFRQITKDDTYVQMLVDEGRITAEEAQTHPHRSLVSRVLQGLPTDPMYTETDLIEGDRYLLCSDGLSSVVSATTIEAALRRYGSPDRCTERLVELALRAGAPDNVTVVVGHLTVEGAPEHDEDATVEVPMIGESTGELRLGDAVKSGAVKSDAVKSGAVKSGAVKSDATKSDGTDAGTTLADTPGERMGTTEAPMNTESGLPRRRRLFGWRKARA
jgi:protein phosphatase